MPTAAVRAVQVPVGADSLYAINRIAREADAPNSAVVDAALAYALERSLTDLAARTRPSILDHVLHTSAHARIRISVDTTRQLRIQSLSALGWPPRLAPNPGLVMAAAVRMWLSEHPSAGLRARDVHPIRPATRHSAA